MAEKPQESKTTSVGVACTVAEKRDVELVVLVDDIDGGASALLRRKSLDAVLRRAREIRQNMGRLRDDDDNGPSEHPEAA